MRERSRNGWEWVAGGFGKGGEGGERPSLLIPPATIAAEQMSTWRFFSLRERRSAHEFY